MRNYDRHIFLYAKGHYQISDQTEDMKKIIGERAGIEPNYIGSNDILQVLINIAWNYINTHGQFIDFINDLNPINAWKHGYLATASKEQSISDFNRTLISKCLSVLRFQKVTDIPFELGKADPTILPLNQEYIKCKKETNKEK